MAVTRDRPEEIVVKPREVAVLQGQGASGADAVREIGVTVQIYNPCVGSTGAWGGSNCGG